MHSDLCREDELECYEFAGELALVGLSDIGRRMGFDVCVCAIVPRSPSNGTYRYSPEGIVGMGWRTVEILPLVLPHFVLVLPTRYPSHTMRLTASKNYNHS